MPIKLSETSNYEREGSTELVLSSVERERERERERGDGNNVAAVRHVWRLSGYKKNSYRDESLLLNYYYYY